MDKQSTPIAFPASSYVRSDSSGIDDEDYSAEFGTTPPFTARMLKKEKEKSFGRKKPPKTAFSKRLSDPLVETKAFSTQSASPSTTDDARRHAISSTIERKRNRDAKQAEQRIFALGNDFGGVAAASKEEISNDDNDNGDEEEEEEEIVPPTTPLSPNVVAARHEFCKTYAMLVKLGTNKRREKEAVVVGPPPPPSSSPLSSPVVTVRRHFSHPLLGASGGGGVQISLMNELWIELQAYIDCRTYDEEVAFLSQARYQVGTVIDDIVNFSMKKVKENAAAAAAAAAKAAAKAKKAIERLTSPQQLPHVLSTGPEDSLIISHSYHREDDEEEEENDDRTLINSTDFDEDDVAAAAAADVGHPSCPINMPQKKFASPSGTRRVTTSESPVSSITLQRRRPAVTAASASVEAIFREASCITRDQLDALDAVRLLMMRLENSQSYYPTLGSLARDYPLYNGDTFQRRLRALNLWCTVMTDLHQKIESLTAWLGVTVAVRPYGSRVKSLRSQALRRLSLQTTISRPRANTTSLRHDAVATVAAIGRERIRSEECNGTAAAAAAASLPPELLLRVASGDDPDSREKQEIIRSLFYTSGGGGSIRTEEATSTSRYRAFVDKALKQMSLGKLMGKLRRLLHPTLKRAHNALTLTEQSRSVSFDDEQRYEEVMLASSPASPPPRDFSRQASAGVPSASKRRKARVALSYEIARMALPSFRMPFIRMLAVPVDVIHECMRLRLEHKPQKEPSALSIKQLIVEYKEAIKAAVEAKKYFRKMLAGVIHLDGILAEIVDSEREDFEDDLKDTLEVYFEYFVSYVNMLQVTTEASRGLKHLLEEEWQFVKEITPHIRSAEAEAGRRFCVMAASLLVMTADYLQGGIDHCFSSLEEGELYYVEQQKRHKVIDVCRYIKSLFHEARERASKALGFAKMLRKDLEIAADFTYSIPTEHLLEDLKATEHVQVKVVHEGEYMMFVPRSLKDSSPQIVQLLNVTCGREESGAGVGAQLRGGYLLLLPVRGLRHSPGSSLGLGEEDAIGAAAADSLGVEWTGPTVEVNIDIETTIGLTAVQVGHQLKLIVSNSSLLLEERKRFCRAMGKSVSLLRDQTSSHEDVADRLNELKDTAVRLGLEVLAAVARVDNFVCDLISELDEIAIITVRAQYVETILSCFNFGFEYMKEVSRLVGSEDRSDFCEALVNFATKWMDFVVGKCEKGRGRRPRWATQGLEFLILACESNLSRLSEANYQTLKRKMNDCITHVIGEAGDTPPSSAGGSASHWRSNSPTTALTLDRRRLIGPSPLRPSTTTGARRSASVPSMIYNPLTIPTLGTPTDTAEEEDAAMTPAPSTGSSTSSGVNISDSPPSSSSTILHPPLLRTGSSEAHVRPIELGPIRRFDSTDMSSALLSPASTVTTPGLLETSLKAGIERQGRRFETIRRHLERLDNERMAKLKRKRIIGSVSEKMTPVTRDSVGLRVRHVNFPWQRGRKIGEGRYGKVYTSVNMETGELMAVKEIHFQGNSHSAVKELEDEISILEELHHPNLVRYFGVEVHKEEMFIFMEYCGEGTIWNVAKQGLPEPMIRSYTKQILVAISVLHENGIVHRDVKGVNIFLSSDGLIKLGDFGCSVKLQNLNTTRPGEISSTRGTVAYMAPEVITSDPSVGSGRAADIWSLGCVVVEMTTGKRPWPEFDHEYSIMFQVGSGKSPASPDRLSDEGKNFLRLCFEHNPRTRWTANKLLNHAFVKVGTPDLELTV